jgi:hypothetical protein
VVYSEETRKEWDEKDKESVALGSTHQASAMRRDQFTCLIDSLVRFGVVALFGPSRDLMLAWPLLLSDLDLTTTTDFYYFDNLAVFIMEDWGPHVQANWISYIYACG